MSNSEAREAQIGGATQIVRPPDFEALRNWWHEILRSPKHYSCYAFFLCLPSDTEAIGYVTDFGGELDLISGEDCLVLALSKTRFKRSRFDKRLWEHAIGEQGEQGYSLEIAKRYRVKLTDFPCILLFEDIRSNRHETFSFRGKTAKEIADEMRMLFSVIREAVTKKEKPLALLKRHKTLQHIHKVRQSLWNRLTSFTEKAFESAVEAWLKVVIK